MNNKTKRDTKPKKSPVKPMKAIRQEALEELRCHLRLLVALQQNAIAQEKLTQNPEKHDQDRLSVYDRFAPLLVGCFERLESALAETQPGGRPLKALKAVAFDVLTDYFIENGDMPQAKDLIKKMKEQLPDGSLNSDESGTEPFSLRAAQDVIRDFKGLLQYKEIDEN
jgi:hypothetical protein